MENKLVIKEHTVKQEASSLKNGNTSPGSKKYKPYPKYKPSGVEWIGEIPEEWEMRRLTTVLKCLESGSREKDSIEIEDGVISIGGEHIGWQGEMLIDNPRYISLKYYNTMNKGKVNLGDVLLVKDGATIGKTAYVHYLPKKAAINEHVFLMRGRNEITQKYLFYCIFSRIGQEQINLSITGSAQPGLNRKFKLITYLLLPPLPEQQAIAAFLDRETEHINSIITKQTRMIELLKEKRSALITQAVTRGLYGLVSIEDTEFAEWATKNVKYKPSGVEWIGEIPEEWEVRKLKWTLSEKLKYGANETAELDDTSLPRYIRITDFDDRGLIRDETFKSLNYKKAEGYYLKEGDVLFARSGATVGKTFQFKNYKGIACFAGYLIKATPNPSILLSDFLTYYTRSNAYESWKNAIFIQATIQNIGADKYAILQLTLPPLPEQKAITAFLDRETSKIDTLVSKIEKQIELLIEYKQSLITHAVTGKIDVREVL